MYQLSANIELLFTEAGPDYADRVRAAAAAGFDAVEIWGTFEKDLDTLGAALRDTGVTLTSVLAEPRTNFTLPWETDRTPFLDGLARGVDNARLLGSPRIVVGSGIGFPGMKRVPNLQKLIDAFGHGCRSRQGLRRHDGPGAGQHPRRPPRHARRPHRRRGDDRRGRQ